MNLWVRSQDKMKMLLNPKLAIIISGDAKNGYSFDIYDTSAYNQEVNLRYGYLGTYDTKERALEVLDEIQNYIIGKLLHNDGNVYEMPKE